METGLALPVIKIQNINQIAGFIIDTIFKTARKMYMASRKIISIGGILKTMLPY